MCSDGRTASKVVPTFSLLTLMEPPFEPDSRNSLQVCGTIVFPTLVGIVRLNRF